MPKILLIETATDICSIAIAQDGTVLALEELQDRSCHTSMITLFIEKCTKQSGIRLADLDAIAISKGPGSYTSLRVGASVAKGLCYTLQKPLIAISTLKALAWASKDSLPIDMQSEAALYLPMIDARRMEVYGAIYDSNMDLIGMEKPIVLTNNLFVDFAINDAASPDKKMLVLSGNGSEKSVKNIFHKNTALSTLQKCSAAHLRVLAESAFLSNDFQGVSHFIPTYIKTPNITVSKTTHF